MNNFVVRIVFVALGLAVAVPSLAGDAAAAPSPMAASTCSILMGGGGMVFADDAQNNKWFMVNRAVSSAVSSSLQNMGYRIDPLIVDIRDKAQRMKALATEVAREKCNRVIQITNGLSGESETMPGVAKDFEFDVSVLGVAADGKLTGLFQKTYSYPLTKEVMASLSMSEVGRTIASDIDHARVISKVPTIGGNGQGK